MTPLYCNVQSRLLPASSGVLDVARKGNVGQLFQAVTARAATHNRDKNIDEALVVCEADYNGNTALHIAAEANNLMAARWVDLPLFPRRHCPFSRCPNPCTHARSHVLAK